MARTRFRSPKATLAPRPRTRLGETTPAMQETGGHGSSDDITRYGAQVSNTNAYRRARANGAPPIWSPAGRSYYSNLYVPARSTSLGGSQYNPLAAAIGYARQIQDQRNQQAVRLWTDYRNAREQMRATYAQIRDSNPGVAAQIQQILRPVDPSWSAQDKKRWLEQTVQANNQLQRAIGSSVLKNAITASADAGGSPSLFDQVLNLELPGIGALRDPFSGGFNRGGARGPTGSGPQYGVAAGLQDISTLSAPLGYPQEQVAQGLYAGLRARDKGASPLQQTRVGLAGLPGLGFLAGHGVERSYVEDVNSWEERQALRDTEGFESVGERVFGDVGIPLTRYIPGIGDKNIKLSGLGDLTFQLASDPLTYTPWVTGRLGAIGSRGAYLGTRAAARELLLEEVDNLTLRGRLASNLRPAALVRSIAGEDAVIEAQRLGRAELLERSPVARQWVGAAERVIEDVGNLSPTRLRRAFPGLHQGEAGARVAGVLKNPENLTGASRIYRAAVLEGREAAIAALKDEFILGRYSPKITLRRQLAATLSEEAGGLGNAVGARGVPIFLGEKVVRPSSTLRAYLERASGRVGEGMTLFHARTAGFAVENAVAHAMLLSEGVSPLLPDFWRATVRPEVEKLSLHERAFRLWDFVDDGAEENIRAFERLSADEIDGELWDRVTLREAVADQLAAMDALAEAGDFDAVDYYLRRLEGLVAVLDGKAGSRAEYQARAILRMGWDESENTLSPLLRDAAHRVERQAMADIPGVRKLDLPPRPMSAPRMRARIGSLTRELDTRLTSILDAFEFKDEPLARGRYFDPQEARFAAAVGDPEVQRLFREIDALGQKVDWKFDTASKKLKLVIDGVEYSGNWSPEAATRWMDAQMAWHYRQSHIGDVTDVMRHEGQFDFSYRPDEHVWNQPGDSIKVDGLYDKLYGANSRLHVEPHYNGPDGSVFAGEGSLGDLSALNPPRWTVIDQIEAEADYLADAELDALREFDGFEGTYEEAVAQGLIDHQDLLARAEDIIYNGQDPDGFELPSETDARGAYLWRVFVNGGTSENRRRVFQQLVEWMKSSTEYQAEVQSLRDALPEEVTVFRADRRAPGGLPYMNVTLNPTVSEHFVPEPKGLSVPRGGGEASFEGVKAYKVPREDIIGILSEPELELVVSRERIKDVTAPWEEFMGRGDKPPTYWSEAERDSANWLFERTSQRIDQRLDRIAREHSGFVTFSNTDDNIAYLRTRSLHLPPALRAKLDAELTLLAASGEDLATVHRQLEALIGDPVLAREANLIALSELARLQSRAIVEEALAGAAPHLTWRSPIRAGASLLLSVVEGMTPTHIPFDTSVNQSISIRKRVEAGERWLEALGFDPATRIMFERALYEAKNEHQVFALIDSAVGTWATAMGIDPDELIATIRTQRVNEDPNIFLAEGPNVTKKGVAGFGREVTADVTENDPLLLSQKIQEIRIPDPQDMRIALHKMRAGQRVEGFTPLHDLRRSGSALRSGLGGVYRKPRFGSEQLSYAALLHRLHTLWKRAVVTNLPAVGVGAVAGFAAPDQHIEGLPDSRWQRALIGAGIGALGPVRYLIRVVGIEERLRLAISRGFMDSTWVPVVGGWWRRSMDVPLPMRDTVLNELTSSPLTHLADDVLTEGSHLAVVLDVKSPRFVDGWWRIVNYQVNPETDNLMGILLAGFAHDGMDEASGLALNWLKTTKDGADFLERLGVGAEQAINNYTRFLDNYMTPELAQLRLSAAETGGQIGHDTLKGLVKKGEGPDVIHAIESWKIPRNSRQLLQTARQLPSRLTLQEPTLRLNRIPMAQSIYRDEIRKLVSAGIAPELAREIAEEKALDIVNSVMFNLSNESRFAQRADLVAPFQQPREEMIRVYGRLAVQHPARTLRLAGLMATAFNNGQDSGMFYKDPASGDWVMRVPGSAYLSEHFGLGFLGTLDFRIQDAFFFLQTQGSFFDENMPALNMASSVLPHPGGPFWNVATRRAFNAFPGVQERLMNTPIYGFLFPYGATGYLSRPEARRLWMGFMGTPAPWEFASEQEQLNELRRSEQNVYNALVYQAVQKFREEHGRTPDEDEILDIANSITHDEIVSNTSAYFLMRASIGGVMPAAVRVKFNYKDAIERSQRRFVDPLTGELNYAAWSDAHPEYMPMVQASSQWIGPQDWEHWDDETNWNEENPDAFALHYRETVSLHEYRSAFREAMKISRAWDAYHNAQAAPTPEERERLMLEVRRRYGDVVNFDNRYEATKALARILANTSPGGQRQDAVNRWRLEYSVKQGDYERYRQDAREFRINPWAEGRDMEVVGRWVDERVARGGNVDALVARLSPAEQVRYWTWRKLQLHYYADARWARETPDVKMAEWYAIGRRISAVYNANPELLSWRDDGRQVQVSLSEFVKDWRGDYYEASNAINNRIYNELQPAIDQAEARGDWSTARVLKDQRTQLYDLLRALKNRQFSEQPDWGEFRRDLLSQFVAVNPEDWERTGQKLMYDYERYDVAHIPSNEEYSYLKMTPDIRRAYVDNLVNRLNIPPGEFPDMGPTKLFWGWLTDFQRTLLRNNLSGVADDLLYKWQSEDPDSSYGGGGNYYRRRGGYRRYGGRGGASGELGFAYEMFKRYNRRNGMPEPAGYQEYLSLPNDPAIRADFLDKHPDVAQYIKLGPMANMPPIYRYLVADIMIRNGKWEGDVLDTTGMTELAFAQEIFARYNRRGFLAKPSTYDIWVNMPTGEAKAAYLNAHPEIQNWIRLGPMANMPSVYQDVVRDIMQRYGEWTQNMDPLSQTIAGFYNAPTWAREKYLDQHPELREYWRVLRSPQEQRMFNLSTQYFAIQDPNARRVYLSAHPELQQYFVEQRSRRYEDFLMQIGNYLAVNPALFELYLKRQEDILSELFRRFGTMPLVAEVPRLEDTNSKTGRRTDAGRTRNVG